jgi:hypothetical protein
MKIEERQKIKDRFQIIFDFINSNYGQNTIYNNLKETFENAFENNDDNVLKEINKELDVWLIEMFRPSEKAELSRLLKERLNEDTEQADFKRFNRINKIIKRGKINTLSEYALLKQRVEEIYADESKSNEIELINSLLAEFYKS